MGVTQSTQRRHVLETNRGKLEGLEFQDKAGNPVMYRYTKIPYAHPPTGDLRWRRPKPLDSSFTFDGQGGTPGDYTRFGPICPQPIYDLSAALTGNPNTAPDPGNVEDEDCLYLNIWVPAGAPPSPRGWPVQVFLHGGWLQVGTANQNGDNDPFDLLATSTKRVIVVPTYRLNLFGFAGGADLASLLVPADSSSSNNDRNNEPFTGNFGFWDQRLALEWTYANVALFSGDRDLISVGGLSAGAHSAFMQLYHDTYLPPDRQLIKQVYMYSNALAIQPNPTPSAVLTEQFASIATALDMDASLSATEKIARLRATPWQRLRDIIPTLKYHTFRASTDGAIADGGFVPATFLASLHDGSFATRLAARGTRLMFGEVRDEGQLYKLVNPPSDYDGLITQLCNYYPRPVVDALVRCPVYGGVPSGDGSVAAVVTAQRWQNMFADITADGQVHASIRGLARVLLDPPAAPGVTPVPADRVFRYKINWRAKGLDDWLKPAAGMCHGSDVPIWWCTGHRAGFSEEDKRKNEAFIGMFGRFLQGEKDIGWNGSERVDECLLLDEEGNIHRGWKDDNWKRSMIVWDTMWDAQKGLVQHRSQS